MITHEDFDMADCTMHTDYNLPEKVESIEISYDGGRLSIIINNEEAYYTSVGTRDFEITIK